MTAQELIQAAYRKLALGTDPTSGELDDGLEALLVLVRNWSSRSFRVYAFSIEGFSLVAAQASYTIGSSGDFNTTRPIRITGAYVRDSQDVDHPVRIVSEKEYREVSTKSTQGRPYILWYNPTNPLGTIYCYFVPETVETLYLHSIKPLSEVTLATTLVYPDSYQEPLIYNLALRLGPEFGRRVPDDVKRIARDGLNDLISLNASLRVEQVDLGTPGIRAIRYNIDEDG